MAVGVDALVEAFRRLVVGSGFAVAVDAQHLAADFGRRLRYLAIVGVARGDIKEAVAGIEAQTATIVRAGSAEGMIRRFRLVGNVGDDVGAIGHFAEIVADLEAQHPVGARGGHRRRRVNKDLAVLGEVRIDRDTLHARLAFAEQIVRGLGVVLAALHSEQCTDFAVGLAHGEPFALLSEEHRAVRKEGDVPRVLKSSEYGGVGQYWYIRGRRNCRS